MQARQFWLTIWWFTHLLLAWHRLTEDQCKPLMWILSKIPFYHIFQSGTDIDVKQNIWDLSEKTCYFDWPTVLELWLFFICNRRHNSSSSQGTLQTYWYLFHPSSISTSLFTPSRLYMLVFLFLLGQFCQQGEISFLNHTTTHYCMHFNVSTKTSFERKTR
jgi:hypothetical protein